jgi:hypothetical protein
MHNLKGQFGIITMDTEETIGDITEENMYLKDMPLESYNNKILELYNNLLNFNNIKNLSYDNIIKYKGENNKISNI